MTIHRPYIPKMTYTHYMLQEKKEEEDCGIMVFAVSMDHRVKLKESKKSDKCVDLARELTKTIIHETDGDTNCDWCTWNNKETIGKGTGKLGNQRKNRNHIDYSIVKIG